MNAVALKKFVEENQKLAMECSNLLAACNKWERECSLYDHDREALMDFANEADERAKEAEIRNRDLEEEKKKLVEELHFHKFRSKGQLVNLISCFRSFLILLYLRFWFARLLILYWDLILSMYLLKNILLKITKTIFAELFASLCYLNLAC